MIDIKEISITRAEGLYIGNVGKEFKTDSWEGANEILYSLSGTAPKTGYDKTDFKIVFKDGTIYEGRYDLKHFTVEIPNLFEHVRDIILYYAGEKKPLWLSQGRYEESLAGVDRSKYKRFAKEYLGL